MDTNSASRPITFADALLGLIMPTHMQSAAAATFVMINTIAQNSAFMRVA